MNDRKKLVPSRKTLSDMMLATAAVSVVGILTQVVRSKAMALMVGPAGVGTVAVFAQVVSLLFAPVRAIISTALVKWLAQEQAEEGPSRGISYALGISWPLGLLGLVISPLVGSLFHLQSDGRGMLYLSLLLVATAAGIVHSAIHAYLVVRQATRAMAALGLLSAVQTTAVIVALTWVLGVPGQFIGMAVSGVLGAIVAVWVARTSSPGFTLMPQFSTAFNRQAAVLGAMFVFSAFAQQTSFGVARYALQTTGGDALGLSWNGNYQAALTIGETYVGFLLMGLQNYFLPRFSQVEAGALAGEVRSALRASIRAVAPFLLLAVAFRSWGIYVLYSDRFREASTLIGYFAVGDAARCVAVVFLNVLSVRGRIVAYGLCELLAAATTAAVTPSLVHHFGVAGAGYGYVVYYGLVALSTTAAVRVTLRLPILWKDLSLVVAVAGLCFVLDRALGHFPWIRWCVTPVLLFMARPALRAALARYRPTAPSPNEAPPADSSINRAGASSDSSS